MTCKLISPFNLLCGLSARLADASLGRVLKVKIISNLPTRAPGIKTSTASRSFGRVDFDRDSCCDIAGYFRIALLPPRCVDRTHVP
ncbi:hypothetical protein BJ170DRAFT_633450 [Xylariales sp. AK1849]|nr:hypothetical protein BJ170DRAFT_633450 [Xylariales sp. AK1849]